MALQLKLNQERFIPLLEKLIGESEFVQNNPPEHIPEEDRVVRHVLAVLEPLSTKNGGPLIVEQLSYTPGRSNIYVEYPGSLGHEKVVSFVGSHMDVVTADRSKWTVDPFKLTRDGDKLYGRGTTDCLGHVALITDLMAQLAEKKPSLKASVCVLFICNEENATVVDIGVDRVAKEGKIDHLKNGPLLWCDVADSQACMATGGIRQWRLTAKGKLFHSGIPQKAMNAIELAHDALAAIQSRFYRDFAAGQKEADYKFIVGSTLKPTYMSSPEGSRNIIQGEAVLEGDIRLTPFFDWNDVKAKVDSYVAEINADVGALAKADVRGPGSKYELPEEGLKAEIQFEFMGEPHSGVACDLTSVGFKALNSAVQEVTGVAAPYSLTGSLPLIADLKQQGFDVQMIGFGKMCVYHGHDEYTNLSDMANGTMILSRMIELVDAAC
eukprot:CAMPEP_0114558582 /NCGR_PEP_ID=MMETSP0114-20121206/10462_1 /TAXON_ID=31324 /ORGANISM="Goniomonas sp, Strain m" /LENGTH=437 /DNA_ID=CAMNT_0001743989 /DNA_START=8 /DNA_END=1321 /DNA_ORIENTATION=+